MTNADFWLVVYKEPYVRDSRVSWMVAKYTEFATIADAVEHAGVLLQSGMVEVTITAHKHGGS